MDRLVLDIQRCMSSTDGDRGLTVDMLETLRPRLEQAREAVLQAAGSGMLGFMELPGKDPAPLLAYAQEVQGRYDSLLVIGIGGSALGTIALATGLLPFYYNELPPQERGGRPRLYVLDNVDPDETQALLSRLDLKRTLVNVISKSGTTGESMAGYLVIRERLEHSLGREALKDHLVFTTDAEKGTLRQIGATLGVPMFDIPANVGGRFSVLCPVGLLPAALTGMDVRELLRGAQDMADWIERTDGWENPACIFAGVQYLQDTIFQRRVSVMMPYSARLRDVADWYRQLWAESLGKSVDRQGRQVNVGPLPVKSLGVTDQHSQLQLYAEGPDDKVITFLGVGRFAHEVTIPAPEADAESLAYLGGYSLAELLWAEQKGTTWALAERGRPSLTITLPRVDAFHLGSLIYLLEMATAVAGELYDIDAFDQPGVELSKQATYALMGRPGYEDLAGRIK
ncbi:MAG: glucose-6-phosphate isomerase [Thermoleophilia bacterium]|jgi:glucose-6-phosphate isomerase